MSHLRHHRLLLIALGVVCLAPLLASCQQKEESSAELPELKEIFGNGFRDATPVICKVGDLEITQNDLDLRYEELPDGMRRRFSGPDWEKRLLRFMIEEALMVQECLDRKLYLDPRVSQHLISQRRSVLKTAIKSLDIIEFPDPTEQQIIEHYEINKDRYMREGTMHMRHIQCPDRDLAYRAYNEIRQGDDEERAWLMAVAKYSSNLESSLQGGDVGWFDKKGIIPAIPYGQDVAELIWDWDLGLHEPVQVKSDWHIFDILAKEYDRPLTLEECRDRVLADLTPLVREEQIDAFIQQLKRETPIEYYGAYALGQGKSPRELFERAWYANTPEQRIDLYTLILEDYPDSEVSDKALFMLANVYFDTWGDLPQARRYLDQLCREYPESDLFDDAQYMLENLANPDYRRPFDIEEMHPSNQPD